MGLNREEISHHCKVWQGEIPGDDQKSLELLIAQYKNMILKIASGYIYPGKFDIQDAYQEGLIGFIKAVGHFKEEHKTKLSTYAFFWIKQAIGRIKPQYINMIHIPLNVEEKRKKLVKAQIKFNKENGRDATIEELVVITNISRDEIIFLSDFPSVNCSLDAAIDRAGEEPETLQSFISNERALTEYVDAQTRCEMSLMSQEAFQLLNNEMLERTIKMRYGFPPYGYPMSLSEVATIEGISREAARLREERALAKIRKMYAMKERMVNR